MRTPWSGPAQKILAPKAPPGPAGPFSCNLAIPAPPFMPRRLLPGRGAQVVAKWGIFPVDHDALLDLVDLVINLCDSIGATGYADQARAIKAQMDAYNPDAYIPPA